jgi:hypothetical protein
VCCFEVLCGIVVCAVVWDCGVACYAGYVGLLTATFKVPETIDECIGREPCLFSIP